MKRVIIFSLCLALTGKTVFAQVPDAKASMPTSPTKCTPKSNTGIDFRLNYSGDSYDSVRLRYEDAKKKIESLAKKADVELTITSENYNFSGDRRDSESTIRMIGTINYAIKPSEKADVLFKSMLDAGMSAGMNYNMNNNCVRYQS